jgi:NADPH:quinone reductase-like Zn-dependent oxidoreductase
VPVSSTRSAASAPKGGWWRSPLPAPIRPGFRVNRLLLNNIDVIAADWAGWVLGGSGRMTNAWSQILPHLARGALAPAVDSVHTLDGLPHALAALAGGRARGKLIVRM